MIIKKYVAENENDAMNMAIDELGPNVIALNKKIIKPKGILKLFKKEKFELTAAIDDNVVEKSSDSSSDKKTASDSNQNNKKEIDTTDSKYRFNNVFANTDNEYSEAAKNAIEEKINNIAMLLEQQMSSKDNKDADIAENKSDNKDSDDDKDSALDNDNKKIVSSSRSRIINLIKNQLVENEVSPKNVDAIINELDIEDKEQPLDNVLANVYQKIVLKLGEIKLLEASENKPKIVFFVGNTGVGKTTTMAKLASKYKLEKKMDIAMFSLDTYRIAAIEQIKTYANIMNTPLEVVYTPEDMKNCVEKHKNCDLIFVDTAGRSHKNENQKNDLELIINSVEDYEKEIYLVVSATTKYSDLKNIAATYGELFDYNLIFTKLDETRGLGNILNLKLDMNKSLSYVTWGQNVPDDIGGVDPQVIAKKLLGGTE